MPDNIKVYALSTCIHCRHAKDFLDKQGVAYDAVFVDKLTGDERTDTIAELKKYNPRASFPTIVFNGGDKVVVGFIEEKIREALGI